VLNGRKTQTKTRNQKLKGLRQYLAVAISFILFIFLSNKSSLNEAWNKKVSVCWMKCEDEFARSSSLSWRVREWNSIVESIETRSRTEAFGFDVRSQIAKFSRCRSNQKAFEESIGLISVTFCLGHCWFGKRDSVWVDFRAERRVETINSVGDE